MKKLRRCKVYGESGFFHRWIEKNKVIVQCDSGTSFIKPKELYEYIEHSQKTGVYPNFMKTTICKNIFGLVERLDTGEIMEVEPTDIVFESSPAKGDIV